MTVKTLRSLTIYVEFELEQIVPMNDESEDTDLRILRASFCDPYILVLRDDNSIAMLELDQKSGELIEMSTGNDFQDNWRSGCLYRPLDQPQTLAVLTNSNGKMLACR